MELKPCPFCNGKAEAIVCDDELYIDVYHTDDCWIKEFEGLYLTALDEEKAIEAWNTRHEHICSFIENDEDGDLECTSCNSSMGFLGQVSRIPTHIVRVAEQK